MLGKFFAVVKHLINDNDNQSHHNDNSVTNNSEGKCFNIPRYFFSNRCSTFNNNHYYRVQFQAFVEHIFL